MTSIGLTIHFNPMCREDFKERRIVNAIKKICEAENVSVGIGYDEQIPVKFCSCRASEQTDNFCTSCGLEIMPQELKSYK